MGQANNSFSSANQEGATALDHLADEARWVAWRAEERGGKLTKVPHSPHGGPGKADDSSTWGTRREAERRARVIVNGHDGGIGIVLGDIGAGMHLAGLDLDSCVDDDDATISPWAASIVAALDTYAEISPSGYGLKAFFYLASEDTRPFLDRIGVGAEAWGCRRDVPGEDARDHGPAVEVYLAGRYFAVTENRWPGSPDRVRHLDRDDLDRLAVHIPPARSTTSSSAGKGGDNSRSAAAFRLAAKMRRQGKTFQEWIEALRADSTTASWLAEKGDERQLRRAWEHAGTAIHGVSLTDFWAYMPMHNYVFEPTGATWPAGSVNSRIAPIALTDQNGNPVLGKDGKQVVLSASAWLDRFRPVEQMTWTPGLPATIADQLVRDGGFVDHPGATIFNLYRPPLIEPGDPARVRPWLDHVRYIYPDEAEHILDWLAHRVQRPGDKINHALVLGGAQGIGKDTLLEPVKHAVGHWNFQEVSPSQILGRFNGFLRAVILRVSEARDLGEFDRFQFYDHLKACTASPPDVLRIDEKHLREYSIINCCGVVITTNHKTDGIFLPPDDRRHYVAWSDCTRDDPFFRGDYWSAIYAFYRNGGFRDVAAYLRKRNLAGFDPKAPPPKTAAFWSIADANRAPEEPELADLLDQIGNPDAVTLGRLQSMAAEGDFADWLLDRRNRRAIPHRLEKCGYVPVRNPEATDGLWKIRGRRQVAYASSRLTARDRIAAARQLHRQSGQFDQ